jgi:hypothetical protein
MVETRMNKFDDEYIRKFQSSCSTYIWRNDNMKETEKKPKQVVLDIEDYIGNIEKQIKTGFTGKISEVIPISNKDYFKGSGGFDERDGIAVTVKVDQDDIEFSNWFSKPNIRGYEKSNVYAFKQRYNSVPKKDLIVDVIIDDNGFYRIKY